MSKQERIQVLSDFVTDWDIGRRLAQVRKLLSEAFDYDELEQLFGDVEVWEPNHRKPTR